MVGEKEEKYDIKLYEIQISVSLTEVLLEPSHVQSWRTVNYCFCSATVELSSCRREGTPTKPKMFTVRLLTKSFQTSDLEKELGN